MALSSLGVGTSLAKWSLMPQACSRAWGAAGGLVVEVLGQRAEHQNAVNALVLVERTDVVHQLLLARVLGLLFN